MLNERAANTPSEPDRKAPESREIPLGANIVLIGYRGVGKSTTAKLLGQRLGLPVVSTDAEIVRRAGKSINDIFMESGQDHFRDLESQVVADVASGEGQIIDTGGGAVLREQNRDALRRTGAVFWLHASNETMAERIGLSTERPSLTGLSPVEEAAKVAMERRPIYEGMADYKFSTDEMDPETILDIIISTLEQNPEEATPKNE